MCFHRLLRGIAAWLFGEDILTKEKLCGYLEERERCAAAEAEERRREEAQERDKFRRAFPFKIYPEWDCLGADPWREQGIASYDFDRKMNILEKEEDNKVSTIGYVRGVAGALQDDIDYVYADASAAYREVRELEERIGLVIGPIPYLPLVQEDAEDANNWN